MHITLISPRLAIQKGDFLGSGVPYWPLEIAILAAFLKENGRAVTVIDLFGEAPSELEDFGDYYLQGMKFNEHLNNEYITNADFFIIYALSYMSLSEINNITKTIKALRPDSKVAVLENSQAVTAFALDSVADELISNGAHALICGEAYWNWDEIENYLSGESTNPPGNVIASSQQANQTVNRIFNTAPSYPIPAWELFHIENYWALPYSHGPKSGRFLPVISSRGCPYKCDFCVVPSTNSGRWRGRSAKEVVEELIALRERFSVRHFQFEDLNPTVRGSRWVEICKMLIERNAGIFFYFVSGTKAETININDIQLYSKAGCRYISISPESGSKNVLKAMGKPFDHAHGIALVKECKRCGIYTQACFIVGHPSEQEEDHKLSCSYLQKLVKAGLDEVAVFIVAPFAGSRLHRDKGILINDNSALLSFSPKGREGWEILRRRRSKLIRIFFIGKLLRGKDIWLQLYRSLLGRPRTKMENLPKRVIYIVKIVLGYKIRRMLGRDGKIQSYY